MSHSTYKIDFSENNMTRPSYDLSGVILLELKYYSKSTAGDGKSQLPDSPALNAVEPVFSLAGQNYIFWEIYNAKNIGFSQRRNLTQIVTLISFLFCFIIIQK